MEIDDESRFAGADPLTKNVIGAAIAVHKALGPGLLENVYHECMRAEFEALGIPYQTEVTIPLIYRGRALKAVHRIDLLVYDRIIVEIKAVEALTKVHEAQLLTYLRLTGKRTELLLNFNSPYLRDGIKRLIV